MPTLSPSMARNILHRMGETGQPPVRGALSVNVGTQEILEVLRDEYLVPIRESGRNSSFKLVQAPFGGGKTHFLHCLREVAWKEGFVTAMVGISPQECPFDRTDKIYAAVARSIELPPATLDEEPETGIERVLRRIIEQKLEAAGERDVADWLKDEFARARVDSLAVRKAALLLMQAVLEGNGALEETCGAFLRGETVESSELLRLGIREELKPDTAFRFLRSLVQILRALDAPGVVLLFDELDRSMSLSARRRRDVGDNMRQMIDHCGQATLPALLWLYAVPPEFMTQIVPEYPALEQRLRGAARLSIATPLNPIIDLDKLPLGSRELLQGIGMALLELYQLAHEKTLTLDIQKKNIAGLAQIADANQFEVGARRDFVKKAVQMLSLQSRVAERILPEADLRNLWRQSSGAAPAPAPKPKLTDEEDIL